jgi:hypothetical protein
LASRDRPSLRRPKHGRTKPAILSGPLDATQIVPNAGTPPSTAPRSPAECANVNFRSRGRRFDANDQRMRGSEERRPQERAERPRDKALDAPRRRSRDEHQQPPIVRVLRATRLVPRPKQTGNGRRRTDSLREVTFFDFLLVPECCSCTPAQSQETRAQINADQFGSARQM